MNRLSALAIGFWGFLVVADFGFAQAPKPQKSKKANWTTFWNTRKPKKSNPLELNLTISIPQDPEKFTYVVEEYQKGATVTDIPVFLLDTLDDKLLRKGSILAGTSVKLIKFKPLNRENYFGVIKTDATGQPDANQEILWISGRYLKISGVNPAPTL